MNHRVQIGWQQFIRLMELPAPEQRLLFSAALVVATVRLALWLFPFRAIHALVSKTGTKTPTIKPETERIAWAITLSSRYVPRASCLTQALAGQILLNRAGRQSILMIGVAKPGNGRFEAHAWLESEGKVVLGEAELRRYTRLPDLKPAAGRARNATCLAEKTRQSADRATTESANQGHLGGTRFVTTESDNRPSGSVIL